MLVVGWSVVIVLGVTMMYFNLCRKKEIRKQTATAWYLSAVFKLAVILIVFIWRGTFIDRTVWVDTVHYFETASSLASGDMHFLELFRDVEWPPHVGYEIFLGLVFKLTGSSEFFAGFLNGFLSIVTSYVLYKIASFSVSKDRALLIAALFNLYPLVLHFSVFVLKDIIVMLLCACAVLSALQIMLRQRKKCYIGLGLSLFALLFFRSFYTVFLALWFVICNCVRSSIGKGKRFLYVLGSCVLAVAASMILSSGQINAGYTIGGEHSHLNFIPQMRLTFSFASFIELFKALGSQIFLFIRSIVVEIVQVLIGPFYWTKPDSIFYLYSTTQMGYRYVFFENLASIFMIVIAPGYLYYFLKRSARNEVHKMLQILILILFCSLILVGDIRWKLSMMPYIILISLTGMMDRSKTKWYLWLLFEGLLSLCLIFYVML